MAIERSIRINIEAGNAKSEIDKLAKSIRDADKAADGAKSGLDALEKEAAQVGSAAAKTKQQTDSMAASINNIKAKKANGDVRDLSKSINDINKSSVNAAKGLNSAEKEINDISKAAATAKNNTDNISKSLNNVEKTAASSSGKLAGFGKKAGAAGIQIQQFVGQVQGGVSPMIALSQQAADLGIVLGAPLLGAIAGITASFAGPLISALIGSKEEASSLEDALESLSKVAETTQGGISRLTNEIGELAKRSRDAAIARIAAGLADAQNVILGTSKSISDLSEKLTDLTGIDVTRAALGVDIIGESSEKSKLRLDDLRGGLSTTQELTNNLSDAVDALSETYGINNNQSVELIKRLSDVEKTKSTDSVQKLAKFLSELTQQTGFSNAELNKFSAGVNNAAVQMDDAENVVKLLNDALSDLDEALDTTEESTSRVRSAMSEYGSTVSGIVSSINIAKLEFQGLSREAFIQQRISESGAASDEKRSETIRILAGEEFDLAKIIKDRSTAEREAATARAKYDREREASIQKIENEKQANIDLISTLENQLIIAREEDNRTRTQLSVVQRLNIQATDEEIQKAKELSGLIFDANEARKQQVFSYDELKAKLDPLSALTENYLNVVRDVSEAELDQSQEKELLIIATKRYKERLEDLRKQQILNADTNESFFGALFQGFNDAAETAESSFDKIREFGRETVDNLSDAFSEFVTAGEFDFRNFASNIIAELLRIETKARILEGIELFKGERKEGGGFLESVAGAIGGVFGGEDKDGGGGIASFFGFAGGDKSTAGGGEEETLRLGGLFNGGGDSGFGQESAEMFGETWTNTLDDVGGQFDEVFGNALAQSDQLGSSTESAAASIGTSLVSSLVKLGAQALINSTIGAAANAALVTAGSAAASALATAWAPAAAAASLATAGGNAIPAGTGISTIYGLTQTLSSGVGGAGGAGGATGGTFARGGVELSDLSGSVISTPTKFAAGGSFNNQLGEAGAEAILPLQKTAGGELGVKATMEGMQMQQAAPQVNVPVRVVNVARDPEDYLSSSEGEKVIVNIMNRNKGVFSA